MQFIVFAHEFLQFNLKINCIFCSLHYTTCRNGQPMLLTVPTSTTADRQIWWVASSTTPHLSSSPAPSNTRSSALVSFSYFEQKKKKKKKKKKTIHHTYDWTAGIRVVLTLTLSELCASFYCTARAHVRVFTAVNCFHVSLPISG